MSKALQALKNKIQWLVDNDKLSERQNRDYYDIITGLEGDFEILKNFIQQKDAEMLQLTKKLQDLKTDTRKMLIVSSLCGINIQMAFSLDEKALEDLAKKRKKHQNSHLSQTDIRNYNFYYSLKKKYNPMFEEIEKLETKLKTQNPKQFNDNN